MRTDGIRTLDDIKKRVKVDAAGCWIWQRSVNSAGYGTAYFPATGKIEGAHRVVWMLLHGPIPKGAGYHGTCVLHRCDVKPCCNPEHLFDGSHQDNIRDRDKKKRGARHDGVHNGRHKLTADAIPVIRAAIAGGASQSEIAKAFGVAQTSISRIVLGKGWRSSV